jgi:hypothetical protein
MSERQVKRTGCGRRPNGTKTHNQCYKTGIKVGYAAGIKKGKKQGEMKGEIKGYVKGKKSKKVYTREELVSMKKGGLEDIGKRVFKLTNMRKTKKADIINMILREQRRL